MLTNLNSLYIIELVIMTRSANGPNSVSGTRARKGVQVQVLFRADEKESFLGLFFYSAGLIQY